MFLCECWRFKVFYFDFLQSLLFFASHGSFWWKNFETMTFRRSHICEPTHIDTHMFLITLFIATGNITNFIIIPLAINRWRSAAAVMGRRGRWGERFWEDGSWICAPVVHYSNETFISRFIGYGSAHVSSYTNGNLTPPSPSCSTSSRAEGDVIKQQIITIITCCTVHFIADISAF